MTSQARFTGTLKIDIEPDQVGTLDRLASDHGTTRAFEIRKAIDTHIRASVIADGAGLTLKERDEAVLHLATLEAKIRGTRGGAV